MHESSSVYLRNIRQKFRSYSIFLRFQLVLFLLEKQQKQLPLTWNMEHLIDKIDFETRQAFSKSVQV